MTDTHPGTDVRPALDASCAPTSALEPHDMFTVVFAGDLRRFTVNPFKIKSAFGRVIAIGIGNAFDEIEEEHQRAHDASPQGPSNVGPGTKAESATLKPEAGEE